MGRLVKYRLDVLEDIISKLHIDESRFINCCLIDSNQSIKFKEEKYHPVDVARYAKLQSITKSKAMQELIKLCEFHKTNALRLEVNVSADYVGTLHTSLIYEFIVIEETGVLLINWNPKFIPYISGNLIPGKFLTIDSTMDGVSSNRRYSMYMLLTKNLYRLEKEGEFWIKENEIREGIGLTKSEYGDLRTLHAKILKPTLGEIYNRLGKSLSSKIVSGRIKLTYKEEVR
jgi:hypothetical protein